MFGDPDKGPKSEWARYAYGYSDKKPGAFFWITHAIMLAAIILLVVFQGRG